MSTFKKLKFSLCLLFLATAQSYANDLKAFDRYSLIDNKNIICYYAENKDTKSEKSYLKINMGISSFRTINQGGKPFDFFRTSISSENSAPNFGIGIGYSFSEKVRFDLMLDHYTNLRIKDAKHKDKSLKSILNVYSLNGYVDIYKIQNVKIFFGAGLGLAVIGENVSVNEGAVKKSFSNKSFGTHFSFTLGSSYSITEDVILDISYNWKEFGTTKKIKSFKEFEIGKNQYRSHNLSASIRFFF